MQLLIKCLSLASLFILFSNTMEAQNKYPFNNDRSIKIGNPFTTSSQISFYFQVQSTSTKHGYHDRIFGASRYFFELADHGGQLAFYNGRTWYDLGINIREKKKDIFLIFDKGVVSIYDGDKLVTTKKHISETFRSPELYIGSTYHPKERFIGEIDFVMIHNRILSRKEITAISKGEIQDMINTSPHLFYDFINGKTYERTKNYRPFNIRLSYGLKIKDNFEPMFDDSEPKAKQEIIMEEAVVDPGYTPKVSSSASKDNNNFKVKLSKVDQNNWEYEGKIISDPKLIEPGKYDLIIKSDGTVTIKIKVAEEKN